ncbi:MAG: FG-GAP-like repeat-containing protein [Ignavibacteriaceae bacterium]
MKIKQILLLLFLLPVFILRAQTPDPNAWALQPWMQVIGKYNGEQLGTTVSYLGKKNDSTLIAVQDGHDNIYIYQIKTPDDTLPKYSIKGDRCLTGDFNGDGIEDLVVGGSPLKIYLGKSPGVFEDTAFFTKYPEPNSVEPVKFNQIAVGKINGDKYDDLVIADYNYPNDNTNGKVYVYFSGTKMDTVADFILTGEHQSEGLGYGIATGDLNNDGFDDILVKGLDSSEEGPNGTILASYIKIYLGGYKIDTSAWKCIKGGRNVGRGVASFDVNGDGVKDLLWCSGNDTTNFLDIHFSHNSDIDTITSIRILNGWALFVTEAGDMNGDGYNDILIGGGGSDQAGNSYIFVYSGGPKMDTKFDAAAGLGGESDFGSFGRIAAIGDINNDGYSDILIGARNYQWGSYQGYFAILLGSKNIPTNIEEKKQTIPNTFTLLQNYPNPFNPSTTIRYVLTKPSKVWLSVYDLLGQRIKILVDEEQTSGEHQIQFDGSGYSSGTYFYKLTATDPHGNKQTQTKSMLLIK